METMGCSTMESYQADDVNLAGPVMENIKRAGYDKPTPVQKHALPILCAGYDIMACAQTGSGKTAAFLLPMISVILKSRKPAGQGNGRSSWPRGLILAPTRELVQQVRTRPPDTTSLIDPSRFVLPVACVICTGVSVWLVRQAISSLEDCLGSRPSSHPLTLSLTKYVCGECVPDL
jgi:superfamily II DNA/RNA helicase